MPVADTPLAPAAAACVNTESSTSTLTPTPSQDSGRVDNLKARMNEQSALIASLAQGMHEMLQQMKQLHLDTAETTSSQRPTNPVASGTQASAPTPALGPPPTPAPPAHTAAPTVSEETSQATPTAHGSAGAVGPR
eukprot:1406199-Pleurochrysis_carterae.AAC.1